MKNYNNNNKYISKLIIFLITLLIYLLIIGQVVTSITIDGSIIYIDKYEKGNFSSIQEGIDVAKTGDTVFVYNGTYYENIVIDKSIILIGENKNSTIIDGRETGNVIKINANNVKIKGFTIQHSGLVYPNSGINISSDYNIIEGNNIIDNYYGITLYLSSYNIIRDNLIQNDDHCGIYMSRSSNNDIINNTIKNNRYNGIGIYDNSNSNSIQNNSLTLNNYCGVNIHKSSYNLITGNDLSENNIGVHLPNSDNLLNNNSFINNNLNIERGYFSKGSDFIFLGIIIFAILVFIVFIFLKLKKID